MQGRAVLSMGQKLALVVFGVLAIGSMAVAPEGAVSEMLVRANVVLEPETGFSLMPAQPVPALSFQDENGEQQVLSSLKGKVVVLNFWALWCASCKVEKPLLNRLQLDYANKGLVVLALADAGDSLEMIKNYYANHKITALKPARDGDGTAYRAFSLRGVPSTIILNKQGKMVAVEEGLVQWDNPAVRAQLEALIAER